MINPRERNTAAVPGWTAERVGRLVELWRAQASATKIAESLGGGVTRSAVVGKLHRLGLMRDAAGRRDARADGARRSQDKQRRQPRPSAPSGLPIVPAAAVRPCPVVPRLVGLERLGPQHCRWPYEVAGETAFCGHPAQAGGPYCPDHHRRAYVATLPPLTLEQVQARTFTPLGDLG